MTSEPNNELPTLQTSISYGNTEHLVPTTIIAMTDLPKRVEYTLQKRSNKHVPVHAMAA